MAIRGPNKSTRRTVTRHHMPVRSRQRRATQLSGRLPIFSVRHHVLPFRFCSDCLILVFFGFWVVMPPHRYPSNFLIFCFCLSKKLMPLLFWFLFIITATLLALQLHQKRRIQMVRCSQVARKRPTKSNGTPAKELGLGTDHVRRYRGTVSWYVRVVNKHSVLKCFFLSFFGFQVEDPT